MGTAQNYRDDGHQLELKNVVVSTVKPAEKTAHAEKYDPSVFDISAADFYVPILMLFRPDRSREDQNTLSASEFVTKIKQSLSRILVPYYTFAGRSRKTYDLKMRELLCNDEGVPFIEAEIDEDMEKVVNMDDFQSLSILSGFRFLNMDPASWTQDDAAFPLPGAFIQVTKFRCGGISVNASFLHMVGDGTGMFHFLKEWSNITIEDQISFEPIHDRSLTYPVSVLLDIMAASSQPSTVSELENLEDPVKQGNSQVRKTGNGNLPLHDEAHHKRDLLAEWRPAHLSEYRSQALHVRRECVEQLKQVAKDRNDGFMPTTLDCIQSHLWRGVSRIPSSVDGRKSTIYSFAIEGRQRLLDPPIPASYTGNVVGVIYTPSLEQLSDDPLVEAGIIQHLVRSFTPQYWKSHLIDGIAASKNNARNIISSSWYRFPMYEVDFGFGKPIFAVPNSKVRTTACAVILPPRPGSDFLASVLIVMEPPALETLLKDSEFRSFSIEKQIECHLAPTRGSKKNISLIHIQQQFGQTCT